MTSLASRLPGADPLWPDRRPWRTAGVGATPNRQRLLIMVVDDDASIRSTVEDILTTEGYEVALASGGASAIAQVRSRRPALVLLDMRMPRVDGWMVAREVRGFAPDIPIVVMSAAENAAEWAEEIGANGYLAKPFLLDELLACVQRLTRRTGLND